MRPEHVSGTCDVASALWTAAARPARTAARPMAGPRLASRTCGRMGTPKPWADLIFGRTTAGGCERTEAAVASADPARVWAVATAPGRAWISARGSAAADAGV